MTSKVPETVRVVETRPVAQPRTLLLVVRDGTYTTHALPATGDIAIGRLQGSDVTIDHESISRRHALLRLGPPITIEDLGSANGTRVRDAAIAPGERVAVAPGEMVELGSVVVIVQVCAPAAPVRHVRGHDYFEARVAEECARAKRSRTGLALLHVSSGNATGERTERAIAEVVRDMDVVGAYAPGEYEILLPEVNAEHALAVARRISVSLAGEGAPTRIGAAGYPQDGRDADTLMSHARAAALADRAAAPDAGPLVVEDGPMRHLYQLVDRVAGSEISVLILGETGVGKEVLAERLHRRSPRAGRPFLRLNCAALSESLLESELFGHEQGAFTGAAKTKPGLLETADGGTAFLDEIGECPPAMQVKLLRVIEERKVMRVGGLESRAIDVRFLAATNRDLDAEVARGAFRQDLYFRLDGITLYMPPLRDRGSEILPLAHRFAEAAARRDGRSVPRIDPEAEAMLLAYAWPGNIRELRNVVERAVLLASGDIIEPQHLPGEKFRAAGDSVAAPPPDPAAELPPLEDQVRDLEIQQLREALRRAGGVKKHAAALLGIPLRTFHTKLRRYGLA